MTAALATGPLELLAAAWAALVGGVVGSFLNVVVARVPAGESIVHPGSRCPTCRTPIRWFDNVPVVSWLVLRARCRACGTRISPRYPLVELAGAALALAAFARHGLSGEAAAEFALSAALLALALIDLDTWLLPNAITWPLVAFGLAMGAARASPAGALRSAAYGAGLGFAGFAAVAWLGARVFRREALGFGDVWLLSALGAWFGPKGLLPVVLLASVQGAVVGIALVILGKGQPGPASPTSTVSPSPTPSPTPTPTPSPTPSPTPTSTPTSSPSSSPSSTDPSSAAATPSEGSCPPCPAPVEEGGGAWTAPPSDAVPPAPSPLAEDDWVPPKNAVPFGPFLVAAALEWLWFGAALAAAFPALALFR
jgi:leader peptidase (prepilin peptidase)/N-methyltransferase